MEKQDNTGLGLIIAAGERVRNEKSLFSSALKKLVNSTEEELDDFLKRKTGSDPAEGILRLISGGNILTIKALDGWRLILNAKEVFRPSITREFLCEFINKPGVATPETPIQVHKMVGDGRLIDIFRALPGTWSQKWLSQDQLIEFCETLPTWFCPNGYPTFFLIKKDEHAPIDENNPEENLAVAYVRAHRDGLRCGTYRLDDESILDGKYGRRVISPKIMPSVD